MSKPTNRRAAMAMARDEWDGLTPSMRSGMIGARAVHGGALFVGALGSERAVAKRGLAQGSSSPRPGRLTPWGLLVREAGLAARKEGK